MNNHAPCPMPRVLDAEPDSVISAGNRVLVAKERQTSNIIYFPMQRIILSHNPKSLLFQMQMGLAGFP